MSHHIVLHLVSDATGQTLDSVVRASIAQFSHAEVTCHRWNLIRTRSQLRRVLEAIEQDRGPVLSSVVDQRLQHELTIGCAHIKVRLVNVLDPVTAVLQDELGEKAIGRPGGQYVMDDAYFRRIDAMHFVLAHDDGQEIGGLSHADVILVGISRASKTPTSFYLANCGVKAANVPLIPDLPLPDELLHVSRPIVGLTIDPDVLISIRRHRLDVMGDRRSEMLLRTDNPYIDPERVEEEVRWARRLCARHGWPLVDVSRRSIEETSAAIMGLMADWEERRAAAHPT
ncbi:kinase/pyrophosphorylase [Gluconacetobacter sp. 1b LMG 1731]|uniref:Putative pyruvate, phosphate dikinase regulatory protein n=1 Tax=Gluconacetobacter dulcium TaxID=2729096 RepID=A0A7W4IM90_9PROT|nr:pyruvate, water dikinase regulatory protein [Gluconacetobacter dulcium]MBB2165490.1 kinase/pyrophosphorylase [Gluconacetobacter dulcium]MBB2194626.1 kinase/pyrophosphorylase [Gluconacetobacter dulcium]